MTSHEIGLEALDALEGVEALCLFIAEDERPLRGAAGYADWRLCGAISRVLLDGFFSGVRDDSLLLPTSGRFPMSKIFVIGIGPNRALDAEGVGRALARAADTLTRAKVESVALEVPGHGVVDDGARASALRTRFLPSFPRAQVAVLGGEPLTRMLASTA